MKPYCAQRVIERAQPWLGTLVSIRVKGLAAAEAHQAIDSAFEEIKQVHELMSFHRPDSEVSQLNRQGSKQPIRVHPYTFEVLSQARELSAITQGCFDVSAAAELVRWGWLPGPADGSESGEGIGPEGTWEDIEIKSDRTVRFRRPLWIDLGGIAKGYAVDRAADRLGECGVTRAVVNAGGDIRVVGQEAERIALGAGSLAGAAPVVELADGSVASSDSRAQRRELSRLRGPHVDGRNRRGETPDRFVCVLAERCVIADALTKVILVHGSGGAAVLRQFGASALVFDDTAGWQSVNGGTDGA